MIKIRRGTNVPMVIELTWDDNTPLDLTDVSDITIRLMDISTGEVAYSGSCTIVDASNGKIMHDWTDTSNLYGVYEREIELTYSNGETQIIPSDRLEYVMFW